MPLRGIARRASGPRRRGDVAWRSGSQCLPVFRGIGDDDHAGPITAIVGLVGGANGDVQEVTGLETDGYSVQFMVDCAFENEEELVTVGVEVARVGCTGLESDVAEGQFSARG